MSNAVFCGLRIVTKRNETGEKIVAWTVVPRNGLMPRNKIWFGRPKVLHVAMCNVLGGKAAALHEHWISCPSSICSGRGTMGSVLVNRSTAGARRSKKFQRNSRPSLRWWPLLPVCLSTRYLLLQCIADERSSIVLIITLSNKAFNSKTTQKLKDILIRFVRGNPKLS